MAHINTNSVTIMLKLVGTACNMKCVYCYEHVSNQTVAGISTDTTSVKHYLEQFKDYEHVFIIFHGGEPLLANRKSVEEVLVYIFTAFQHTCHVQFQTNGTLIDDEWLALFAKYRDKLSISISLDPRGDGDLRILPGQDYRTIVMNNIRATLPVVDNLGIISVANQQNKGNFSSFIQELMGIGVKSLTINKCQGNDISYALTEADYVELLKEIALLWIKNRWYQHINIQPLSSLFSEHNRLCIYLPDEGKCSQFKTYYNGGEIQDYCDHIMKSEDKQVYEACSTCDIYDKCGGGCLVEKKDEAFCKARRELFAFIERVKYGR